MTNITTAVMGGVAAGAVTAGLIYLVNSQAPVPTDWAAPFWGGGFIGLGVLVGLLGREGE